MNRNLHRLWFCFVSSGPDQLEAGSLLHSASGNTRIDWIPHSALLPLHPPHPSLPSSLVPSPTPTLSQLIVDVGNYTLFTCAAPRSVGQTYITRLTRQRSSAVPLPANTLGAIKPSESLHFKLAITQQFNLDLALLQVCSLSGSVH